VDLGDQEVEVEQIIQLQIQVEQEILRQLVLLKEVMEVMLHLFLHFKLEQVEEEQVQ
jgi:hypothetical protein